MMGSKSLCFGIVALLLTMIAGAPTTTKHSTPSVALRVPTVSSHRPSPFRASTTSSKRQSSSQTSILRGQSSIKKPSSSVHLSSATWKSISAKTPTSSTNRLSSRSQSTSRTVSHTTNSARKSFSTSSSTHAKLPTYRAATFTPKSITIHSTPRHSISLLNPTTKSTDTPAASSAAASSISDESDLSSPSAQSTFPGSFISLPSGPSGQSAATIPPTQGGAAPSLSVDSSQRSAAASSSQLVSSEYLSSSPSSSSSSSVASVGSSAAPSDSTSSLSSSSSSSLSSSAPISPSSLMAAASTSSAAPSSIPTYCVGPPGASCSPCVAGNSLLTGPWETVYSGPLGFNTFDNPNCGAIYNGPQDAGQGVTSFDSLVNLCLSYAEMEGISVMIATEDDIYDTPEDGTNEHFDGSNYFCLTANCPISAGDFTVDPNAGFVDPTSFSVQTVLGLQRTRYYVSC